MKVLSPKATEKQISAIRERCRKKAEKDALDKSLLIISAILDYKSQNGMIHIHIPTVAKKTKLPEREVEIFLKTWVPCCFD
jgi:hypothetical protein